LPLLVLEVYPYIRFPVAIARGLNFFLIKFIISSSNSVLGMNPGFKVIKALTTSIFTSSGFETTADSPIAGCSRRADSTSKG